VGSINATVYYNLTVLASPFEPIWNQSEPWLNIKPYLCPQSNLQHKYPQNCTELTGLMSPVLSQMQCNNAVVKVCYIIQHNGTEGIMNVKVLLWLDSVPIFTPVYQVSSTVIRYLMHLFLLNRIIMLL
jgi:hypothetical protein